MFIYFEDLVIVDGKIKKKVSCEDSLTIEDLTNKEVIELTKAFDWLQRKRDFLGGGL